MRDLLQYWKSLSDAKKKILGGSGGIIGAIGFIWKGIEFFSEDAKKPIRDGILAMWSWLLAHPALSAVFAFVFGLFNLYTFATFLARRSNVRRYWTRERAICVQPMLGNVQVYPGANGNAVLMLAVSNIGPEAARIKDIKIRSAIIERAPVDVPLAVQDVSLTPFGLVSQGDHLDRTVDNEKSSFSVTVSLPPDFYVNRPEVIRLEGLALKVAGEWKDEEEITFPPFRFLAGNPHKNEAVPAEANAAPEPSSGAS